jgi:carbamoyl-phosphate synthase large subunit
MNILVTAIGSFSAEAVVSSLKKIKRGKIIGSDIHPRNWIATSGLVDSFHQIPIVYKKKLYIKTLLQICEEEKINFIIPLTDPEVDALSEYRTLFEEKNIKVCLSDQAVIRKCRNKYLFYTYFKNDKKVDLIPTYEFDKYESAQDKFPLIAKPKTGRSSEGVFKIENEIDYNYVCQRISQKDYIIQPLLNGNIFTVDFVRNNFTGNCQAICRQELIRNATGAGLTVEVICKEKVDEATRHIGSKLKIHGCVNFEFIEHDEKFYLMDINPRFSAGVAFSILAGYDMVENHLNCFTGRDVESKFEYPHKIIAKKYIEIIT